MRAGIYRDGEGLRECGGAVGGWNVRGDERGGRETANLLDAGARGGGGGAGAAGVAGRALPAGLSWTRPKPFGIS